MKLAQTSLQLPGNYRFEEGGSRLIGEKLVPNFAGKTPAEVINALVPYVFVFAGLILFGNLIMGGLEMMTAAGNPKAIEKGQKRLMTSFIGFLIIFLSYWIMQILGVIVGFDLLSG